MLPDVGDVVGILFCEAEWRDHPEDIAEDAAFAHEDAAGFGGFVELASDVCCWLFSLLVFDDLNTQHQSSAAYIS